MLRRKCAVAAVGATAAVALVPALAAAQRGRAKRDPRSLELQHEFDHIGAEVRSLTRNGRTSYYIDEGNPGDRAVIFIGGGGASLEAFQLTEFARTSRQKLELRVISVERNGFGESQLDLNLGYADYNNEILAVLDHLAIDRFAILAISGGGAYAAQLAAQVPERVISLHAAAAVSSTLPTRTPPDCSLTLEQRNARNASWYANPKLWRDVPHSPVRVIPGWQATAYLDVVRSFYLGGRLGDPSALSHEQMLPCAPDAVVDAAAITAPTYLYWGGADTTVPVSMMAQWRAALPNVVKATVYPGEDHTVQYRHWDQILVDVAGYGDYTVVCRNGQTRLVPNDQADAVVAGGGSLGLCAWAAAYDQRCRSRTSGRTAREATADPRRQP
jgi:pimeloyl-ACP methyl ester carboxylesterase